MAALLLPLQGLTAQKLSDAVPACSIGEARKILSAVHRRGEPLPQRLDGCRSASLAAVAAAVRVPSLKLLSRNASRDDPFVKFLFQLDTGQAIEAVRIPLEAEGRWTVCVSSQAGCAQGCTYCATGRLGLLRSLAAWEIVEQVRSVHLDLASLGAPGRVHGVVFQGMGEPMANLDAVLDAICVLCEPAATQVSASNITVSTVGSHPAGIRRLAAAQPKVRLALSIGSAIPAVRSIIMPSERIHPLRGAVMDAAVHHAVTTGLQPLWAVTPLRGVNDSIQDAEALAELALDFASRTGGIRPRISVVPYNSDGTDSDPFARTPGEEESSFRNSMKAKGVYSHRRYSGGGDVGAACGQLAGAVRPVPAAAGEEEGGSIGGEEGGAERQRGQAGGERVVETNWAGEWAGSLRDNGRPTLAAPY